MNWSGDTVRVPENTVILHSVFDHCAPDSLREGFIVEPGAVDTISVFIIIDQSGSMRIYDSTNVRYDVARNIIDSIYARSPASEVGLAVFANQLLHSYEDNSWFKQLFPDSGWHDSYIPLTPLNDTVDGVPAVEKLKWAIELSEELDFNGMNKLTNGNYGPTGRRNYQTQTNTGFVGTTDISLGFEAAKDAFKSASNLPENQVIIFLSDGEAQNVDIERQPHLNDYILGEGVPATFTAVIGESLIPDELDEMNRNIRNNDYSSFNHATSIWLDDVNQKQRLLNNIITKLESSLESDLGYYVSTPVSMTINGIDALSFTDSTVVFPDLSLPLQGKHTTFDINYTYKFTTTPEPVEFTRDFQVLVAQSSEPQFESFECWEQDSIVFFHEGNEIFVVEEKMGRLEIRFFPETTTHSDIDLLIKSSSSSDSLNLTLTNRSAYWNGSFDWEYGSSKPDNVLQIESGDSIVVIYRNPLIPLDTIRKVLPVVPQRDLAVRNAYYVDTNADGHPNAIRVTQGMERLTAQECSLITQSLAVLTSRNISVKSVLPDENGFIIRLDSSEGQTPFTGLFPLERLTIQATDLPSGGSFPATEISIADSMAPVIVSATYYDFSSDDENDTLVISFSEPVKAIENNQPFIFRSAGREYQLQMEEVKRKGSDAVFSIIPSQQSTPSQGDSIRISTTAAISDTLSNVQLNLGNRLSDLVYVKVYRGTGAYYYDKSGDGLIDLISVTTSRKLDSLAFEQIKSSITLPPHRNFTYGSNDFSLTDSGFTIEVKQVDAKPNTAVDGRDVVQIAGIEDEAFIFQRSSIRAEDRIAPVITEAVFIDTESEGDEIPDTLIVTFSEEVSTPLDSYPFVFTDKNGDTYTMELKLYETRGKNEYVFIVEDIQGRDFPGKGDLVSIDPHANLGDNHGNVQDSANRETPVTIRHSEQKFRIITSQNPFNINEPEIPGSTRSRFGIRESNGLVLIVEPLSRASISSGFKSEFVLYDKVGNIVTTTKGKRGSDNVVYFVWDGKNRNGRLVGTGTYMLIVSIEDPFGNNKYQNTLIGFVNN
ncbi:hypothetical protein CHISP_0528 [Chitinispirillum alkaliphilum]|nr:hypothetical protein CHISP_0528 [Chitinispirillum alkaliphilum]